MSENESPQTASGATEPSAQHLAAEAARLAKAEFEKAQACCDNLRQQAADRLKSLREANLGDAIEKTLDTVKRHPGAGITIAALVGFFLGRLFRR